MRRSDRVITDKKVIEEKKQIATSLGAKFRVREWITNGY